MEDVIIHNGYIKKIGPNDKALIKMKTEVLLNRFVQFACLPLTDNAEFPNATVIGWGKGTNERITKEDLIYHGLSINILQKDGCQFNQCQCEGPNLLDKSLNN